MQVLCALRDALWGVVQTHGSTLPQDYNEHVKKYMSKFDSLMREIDIY